MCHPASCPIGVAGIGAAFGSSGMAPIQQDERIKNDGLALERRDRLRHAFKG
jgi:hypothetical protein